MSSSSRSPTVVAASIAALVLLTRLPFLGAGYGVDYDAWALADAARSIAETGTYHASRRPGYPVVEFALAPLVGGGPFLTNLATAVVSALATVLTFLILRRASAPAPASFALAFAATPVVFLASVSTMDYLWAWSLFLAALLAADGRRPGWAGLFVGLAIGARASSALLMLALLPIVERGARRRAIASAAVAVVASYAPVLWKYGPGWFRPSYLDHPGFAWLAREAGPGVWGEVGLVAIVLALFAFAPAAVRAIGAGDRTGGLARAAAIGAALHALLFLFTPFEAGYLVPFVGCALLLLGLRASPRPAAALAVALLVASFVGFGRVGPVLTDARVRAREERLVDAVVEALHERESATTLLCGPMYSKLVYAVGGTRVGEVELVMSVREEGRLRDLVRRTEVLFVNGIDSWHRSNLGHSLWLVARPILESGWDSPAR